MYLVLGAMATQLTEQMLAATVVFQQHYIGFIPFFLYLNGETLGFLSFLSLHGS